MYVCVCVFVCVPNMIAHVFVPKRIWNFNYRYFLSAILWLTHD